MFAFPEGFKNSLFELTLELMPLFPHTGKRDVRESLPLQTSHRRENRRCRGLDATNYRIMVHDAALETGCLGGMQPTLTLS
jgi:hypothetical protein